MNTMEQNAAEKLTERVLNLVNNQTTDMFEDVLRVEGTFYTDEKQWRAECEMMAQVPAIAAPSAMLIDNGQYIAKTVNNGRRILITRDESGKSHVFLNACRHRGAAVVEDGEGCSKRFTCPYHNWTYANDGSLKGIPFQEGFSSMDKSEHGLIELSSEEKYGLIWYMMNPKKTCELDSWLGDFATELAQWNYSDFQYISHRIYEVPANWKNGLEAFTEFYHFQFVHANSAVGQGTISNVCAFDAFGYHSRLVSALATITQLNTEDAKDYHGSEHLGVIYSIFPNLIIANSPLGLEYLHFFPGKTPDTSVLYYVGMANHQIGTDDEMLGYTSLFEAMQQVVDEDIGVISACAAGLRSGIPQINIGKNETGTQHFIKSVQACSAGFR